MRQEGGDGPTVDLERAEKARQGQESCADPERPARFMPVERPAPQGVAHRDGLAAPRLEQDERELALEGAEPFDAPGAEESQGNRRVRRPWLGPAGRG